MFLTLSYALFWLLCLLYLLVFKNKYHVLIFIVSIWTISSFFSLIFYFEVNRYTNLQIIPFVFLILCLWFSFIPFTFKQNELKKIELGDPVLFERAMLVLGLLSILPFLENLIHIISTYAGSNTDVLSEVYEEKMSGDLNKDQYINWFSTPGRILNSINLKFQSGMLFFLFLYVCQSKINKFIFLSLIIAVINPILFQLGMSGRSALVFTFLNAGLLFFLLKNLIPQKIKASLLTFGVLILIFGIILFFIITLSRYSNNEGASSVSFLGWISLYAGEGALNFNNFMWHTKAYTQGDNCFNFFKAILGMDTFTNILERRAYWGPRIGINPAIFYTFVGDLFSDLSYFVAPFIFFIGITLNKFIKRDGTISLIKMFLLYSWGYLCISGITFYTYKAITSMIDFTVSCIFVFILSKKFIIKKR